MTVVRCIRRIALGAAVSSAALALLAVAQPPQTGYLAPGAFDILAVLPPAPVEADPSYRADREIFRQTRRLVSTPRWALAINDVKADSTDLMHDFSCAMGVQMTPENAPRTAILVARAAADTGRSIAIAKNYYKRLRPFQIDRGPICEPASDTKGSFDYPSGHTSLGWTWAVLLAELAPDRATAILARGRAYGESRIVCGVHNATAVDAGRLSASATLAMVAGSPAFRADVIAARAELLALRTNGTLPDGAACARETALVGQSILHPAESKGGR